MSVDPRHGPLPIAADIGGTFTDVALVYPDGRLATCKVPSTPHDYAQGVKIGRASCRERG